MSRNQVTALVLAVLLAAGVFVSRAARGQVETEAARAPAAETTARAETAAEGAADAPPAEKRKGNSFARALGAPFRALGRLFGGGGKSKPAAKQPREEKPVEVVVAQPAPAKVKPAKVKKSARVAAPPAPPPVASSPAETRATVSEPAVPIIRPDEQPRPAPSPRVWVPVIEGISKDPLTQGRALLEHGYIREAISELSAAASGTQDLAEANNLLGLAYDRLGDHRQAVEAYERALVVRPKDPVLLANLGNSLYLSNDFTGALKRLRQAAGLAPQLKVVHNNLGIVHARLGKYTDAFRSFARATSEYDAHLKIASILEFERREKQAIKHYEAALKLQPGATALLERLVALYERTGERTKADTARRTLGQPKNEQRTTTGGGGG